MFVIAKVPFQKIYYAERFSLSWWASLFVWVLVIFIPFFVANIERYIWRTNLVNRKVPYYEFSNSFIITTEGGTNGNEKKIYSTLGGFTSKIPTSQKLYAVDIATYYEPFMENYFPKEETINIKITEPNVKSVEVGFFMYYNFTVSENFVIKFTDFISIPLDVKTGYTTNIYGDFELFQDEVYQDTKVSTTSFTYDAYANFTTYLDLARQKNYRNEAAYKLNLVYDSTTEKTSVKDLNINIKLNLNSQHSVRITASFVELLRQGWKMYLAFLIPTFLVAQSILLMIFKYKLFRSNKQINIAQKMFREN